MSHCSFFLSLFFIYIYFFFLCLWTFKLQCLKDISYILLLCGWKWTHRNLKWCPNLYSMRGALTPVLHSLASNFWILSWVILIFFFYCAMVFFPTILSGSSVSFHITVSSQGSLETLTLDPIGEISFPLYCLPYRGLKWLLTHHESKYITNMKKNKQINIISLIIRITEKCNNDGDLMVIEMHVFDLTAYRVFVNCASYI